MADEDPKDGAPGTGGPEGGDRADFGLSDKVRRVVSAGFEAASRSKEDIVRAATGEIKNWLDRLDLSTELKKALTKMVIEVKTEIRFRPSEDGKITPEAVNDVNVKPASAKNS